VPTRETHRVGKFVDANPVFATRRLNRFERGSHALIEAGGDDQPETRTAESIGDDCSE
jgi:hypothetical protein